MQGNPLATALIEIVQLAESRYPVGGLLNLLEYPAIRRRFGLDEAGVERITQWLIQAAVHWGRDGDSKRSLGLPPDQGNTWRAGLWQLVLGYAMPGDAEQLWHQHYPLDAVEGSESQWLGGMLAFCDALFALEDQLSISRSPQAWMTFLIGLTEQFFSSDEESEALVAAPDTDTWLGRRDRSLLLLTVQTGLRVSELIGLCCQDVVLGHGAHVVGQFQSLGFAPLALVPIILQFKCAFHFLDCIMHRLVHLTTGRRQYACREKRH